MLTIFKHLLPRCRAWSLTFQKDLRSFFEALVSPLITDTRLFFDQLWEDIFPDKTRELIAWEQAYGLRPSDLTEQERRDRIDGRWKAQGGQSPRYIQDTLRNAGFDVYVHEWWELPLTEPPVARNPFLYFGAQEYGCNEQELQCGEPLAQCGNYRPGYGYMLVNKLYKTRFDYTVTCGELLAQCGEPLAQCGENNGYIFDRVKYSVPSDPDKWPYIFYIGAQTFGEIAYVSEDRKEEFEDLILKISPSHQWVGLFIDYVAGLIERSTNNIIIERSTGDTILTRGGLL